MITGGFGVSVSLGDDGQQRTRRWYMRADGVKRWHDNDQPCEPQQQDQMNSLSNNSYFPSVCAVDGVLHDDFGKVHCARVTGWCGSKICTSREYCEHQRERG